MGHSLPRLDRIRAGLRNRLSEEKHHTAEAGIVFIGLVDSQIVVCSDVEAGRCFSIPALEENGRANVRIRISLKTNPKQAPQINFFNFRPKIACQARKPPKPFKQNKIELAF